MRACADFNAIWSCDLFATVPVANSNVHCDSALQRGLTHRAQLVIAARCLSPLIQDLVSFNFYRKPSMQNEHSAIYVFNTHSDAEEAIRSLGKSGFDVKKLSLIGKGYHSEEHPVGFYSTGDRIKSWGGVGAFWGGIWGLLVAPAVFVLPGVGLVAMAGPIVAMIVAALEGAVVLGGISAIGGALSMIGASKDDLIKYDTAVKADKYVLIVHGDANDITRAKEELSNSRAVVDLN